MSSLVTSASIWTNDDQTGRKRTPTIRRTIKTRPNQTTGEDQDEYVTQSEGFQSLQPTSISDIQAENSDRNARVNELLNKITSADSEKDNNKLGNFKPIQPPSLNLKKDMSDNTEAKKYVPPMPAFYSGGAISATSDGKTVYGPTEKPGVNYSNYMKSYEPPAKLAAPYYAKMGISNNLGDDKLMEKINYMIHLLEEQQNEKTNNITEEFILYTFLGVFIIFIVDGFARSGKYIR